MKILFLATVLLVFFHFSTFGQSKNDSLKLKKDIEAISKGEKVDPPKNQSILHTGDSLPVAVDTTALKPDLPQPIPADPNNPNPHEAVPNPVNPSSPAKPTGYPQPPPVNPDKNENKPKE
ncbi:MAG: hypothetical protein ACO1N7_06665 [Sphingobacteriaceae bacterium]